MRVLQLPQGHVRPADFAGQTLDDALLDLRAWDAAFTEKFQLQAAHRPSWQELDVEDGARVPWGYEWYRVGDDGRLFLHSADYDSSG